jgi:hypothetical protein
MLGFYFEALSKKSSTHFTGGALRLGKIAQKWENNFIKYHFCVITSK